LNTRGAPYAAHTPIIKYRIKSRIKSNVVGFVSSVAVYGRITLRPSLTAIAIP